MNETNMGDSALRVGVNVIALSFSDPVQAIYLCALRWAVTAFLFLYKFRSY